jgi:transcriptional regulator with XRE-family HTH domain
MQTAVVQVDEQVSSQLAENLTTLLKQRHCSPSKVAQDLDIPMMTIRRLMLGETTDPRLSTLKLLADYFAVTIDWLTGEATHPNAGYQSVAKPNFVPILSWEALTGIESLQGLDLSSWKDWQPISSNEKNPLSKSAFALMSRPSMYPRFPQGTIFIFEPDTTPKDGDLVLVRIEASKELTLRELIIDPPEWRLQSLVSNSGSLQYLSSLHHIMGVNVMTLLYR